MRFALGALLWVSLSVAAAEAPLRFVVADSLAMPMAQIEHGRPASNCKAWRWCMNKPSVAMCATTPRCLYNAFCVRCCK